MFPMGEHRKSCAVAGQGKYRTLMAFKAKPYGGSKPVAYAEGPKSAP